MKTSGKLLAMLLTIAILLTLAPVSVFSAAETPSDSFEDIYGFDLEPSSGKGDANGLPYRDGHQLLSVREPLIGSDSTPLYRFGEKLKLGSAPPNTKSNLPVTTKAFTYPIGFTYTWEDGDTTTSTTVGSVLHVYEGDFDGDGRKNEIAVLATVLGLLTSNTTKVGIMLFVGDAADNSKTLTLVDTVYAGTISQTHTRLICGDVNGDGIDEIIVVMNNQLSTYYQRIDATWNTTGAWPDPVIRSFGAVELAAGLTGPVPDRNTYLSSYTSFSIDIGDLDRDGCEDIVYILSGLQYTRGTTTHTGPYRSAYILYGTRHAAVPSYTPKQITTLPTQGRGTDSSPAFAGYGVSICDMENDAQPEILVAFKEVVDLSFNANDTDGFVAKNYRVARIDPSDRNGECQYTELYTRPMKNSGDGAAANIDFNGVGMQALSIAKLDYDNGLENATIYKQDPNDNNAQIIVVKKDEVLYSGSIAVNGELMGYLYYSDGQYGIKHIAAPYPVAGAFTNVKLDQDGNIEMVNLMWMTFIPTIVDNKINTYLLRQTTVTGDSDGFVMLAQSGSNYSATYYDCGTGTTGTYTTYREMTGLTTTATNQLVAALPDIDRDSVYIKYAESNFFWSDPTIVAALMSPPYFAGLANDGYKEGSTTFGINRSDTTGTVKKNENSLGAYAAFEVKAGGIVKGVLESEVSYDHTWTKETEESRTVSYEEGFIQSAGGDSVVLATYPYDIFVYKMYMPDSNDGTTDNYETDDYTVIVPRDGGFQQRQVDYDEYEKIREYDTEHNLPDLSEVFNHTVGRPGTYYTSIPNKSFIKTGTAKTYGTAKEYPVGERRNFAKYSVEDTLTKTETNINTVSAKLGAGMEIEAGSVVGIQFTAGVTYAHAWEKGTINSVSKGVTFEGTVGSQITSSTDPNSNLFGFKWQLLTYTFTNNPSGEAGKATYEFPVVTYVLSNLKEEEGHIPTAPPTVVDQNPDPAPIVSAGTASVYYTLKSPGIVDGRSSPVVLNPVAPTPAGSNGSPLGMTLKTTVISSAEQVIEIEVDSNLRPGSYPLTVTVGGVESEEFLMVAGGSRITFDKRGGTDGTDTVVAEYGGTLPDITRPTRVGYSFQGYYDAVTGGTQYYTEAGRPARTWNKNGSATLYAQWKALTHTITFENNISQVVDPPTVTATYGEMLPSLVDHKNKSYLLPEREGYTLLGYFDVNAATGGTQYYNGDGTPARTWDKLKNTTLYARWKANGYILTFMENYYTTISKTVVAERVLPQTVTPLTSNSRVTFLGFFDTDSHSIESQVDEGPGKKYYNADGTRTEVTWDYEGDLTLYARYRLAPFTCTFDKQGGTGGTDSMTVYFYGKLRQVAVPTREGYYFLGYFTEPDGGLKYFNMDGSPDRVSAPFDADTTLYAHWAEKVENTHHTVYLDHDYEGWDPQSSSVTAVKGETLPTITVPVRAGYTFMGFFEKRNGEGIRYYSRYLDAINVWDKDEGGTIYAFWQMYSYYLTLSPEGGTLLGSKSITSPVYGQPMNPLAADQIPTKEGFYFQGYFSEIGGGGIKYYNADGTSANNWYLEERITLYAHWGTVPPHTHEYGADWKSDILHHWHECECGVPGDYAEHTPGEWITHIPPAKGQNGIRHRLCTVCEYVTEEEIIPALPDDPDDPDGPTEETTLLVLSPSHIVLTETGQTAGFEAELVGGDSGEASLAWTISPSEAPFAETPDGPSKAYTLTGAPKAAEYTVTVTCTVESGMTYTAIGTIEVVPDGIDAPGEADDPLSGTTVKLLENKATLNKALTIPAARVPVEITDRGRKAALTSSEDEASPMAEPPPYQPKEIKLEVYKSVNGAKDWYEVDGFKAVLDPEDNRYILVSVTAARDGNGKFPSHIKTTKKVRVTVDGVVAAEKFTLEVVEKYPKITVKTDALNAFYNNHAGKITATASNGAKVSVVGAQYKFDKKDKYNNGVLDIVTGGDGAPELRALKKGSTTLTLTLALDGYFTPYKGRNTVDRKVSVANTKPKLKLSPSSVRLVGNTADIKLSLLSNDKKKTLKAYGPIESVSIENKRAAKEAVGYDSGVITIPGSLIESGKNIINVAFQNAGTVSLTLTCTQKQQAQVTFTPSLRSFKVNTGTNNGDVVTVNITPNVGDLVVNDWALAKPEGMPDSLAGIGFAPGDNCVTFRVTDKDALKAGKAVLLEFKSASYPKTVKISVQIVDNAATFKMKSKGAIDIADKTSAISVTANLSNTTSPIKTVALYNAVAKNAEPAKVPTTLFEVVPGSISGNTFKIQMKSGVNTKDGPQLSPGATQKLSVEMELENGQTLTSWTLSDSNPLAVKSDKPLLIKPVQKRPKATQSTKAATLYKKASGYGQRVDLGFNSANPHITLGDVIIDPAFSSKYPYFDIVRAGSGSWTLKLKEGFDPNATKPNSAKTLYKSSYSVKLQLWAAGSYYWDGGKLVPAGSGGKMAKPVTVTVKVKLK